LALSNLDLTQVDATTWRAQVTYKDTPLGATCPSEADCTNFIRAGEKLIFRASLTRDGVTTEMRGYDYEINFPLSMASSLFDENPRFQVRPWFFADKGRVVELNVTSDDPIIGTRQIEVYLPPSASENPQPEYDVLLGFDLGGYWMSNFTEILDYEMAEVGRAQEAVVIGFGDYKFPTLDTDERTDLLAPVSLASCHIYFIAYTSVTLS
jgi:hypothetical protein